MRLNDTQWIGVTILVGASLLAAAHLLHDRYIYVAADNVRVDKLTGRIDDCYTQEVGDDYPLPCAIRVRKGTQPERDSAEEWDDHRQKAPVEAPAAEAPAAEAPAAERPPDPVYEPQLSYVEIINHEIQAARSYLLTRCDATSTPTFSRRACERELAACEKSTPAASQEMLLCIRSIPVS